MCCGAQSLIRGRNGGTTCASAAKQDGATFSCTEPSTTLASTRQFIIDMSSFPERASVYSYSSSAMIRIVCDPHIRHTRKHAQSLICHETGRNRCTCQVTTHRGGPRSLYTMVMSFFCDLPQVFKSCRHNGVAGCALNGNGQIRYHSTATSMLIPVI